MRKSFVDRWAIFSTCLEGWKSVRISFVLIMLSLNASLCFADDNFLPSNFFKSGVTYSYSAGTNGFGGGIVRFEQKDEVLHFTVRIRFLGAGTFSRTNLKEVLSTSFPRISPSDQFFGGNLSSFSDNQLLEQGIRKLAQDIESRFKSKYTRLHLIVEFGQDADYLTDDEMRISDPRLYLSALRNAVKRLHAQQKTDAIPISVVALPEANRASPSEWDLYSDPRLFAHELFHVIGSMFEGYESTGYPPNGILQDEYMFMAVEKYGNGRQAGVLLESDVFELLSYFGSAKGFAPAPDNLEKLNYLIQNYASSALVSDDSRLDYISWPANKKEESAKNAVVAWLASSNKAGAFPSEVSSKRESEIQPFSFDQDAAKNHKAQLECRQVFQPKTR